MSWAYTPPVDDILFYLEHCTGLFGDEAEGRIDRDLAHAILTEAGRYAAEVLVPLNASLDRNGARHDGNGVITGPGHKAAFDKFVEDGWVGLNLSEEWGGQGLPSALYAAALEFWHTGSLGFAMGNLLTVGAAETIEAHGSEALKQSYLPRLASGEWTATMALTEPAAGSDLGVVKVKATPLEDGSYAVSGTKIFISYGDHDLTGNIVHLVLARLPDAPEGSRGLSLFLVPKSVPENSGLTPNNVKCVGIEKKVGLHASPTCVMRFGEGGDSRGWLIGQPHRGLMAMFTMMNNARMAVATQGVGASEWAYQKSLEFAKERKQGKGTGPLAESERGIIAHPDVQNMLLTMRALACAGRCIILELGNAIDQAGKGDSSAQARADLLTPIAKAFCTDSGIQSGCLGIQVHGGMGVVEETGIAQVWRDARVTTIHEGTNGIQALDFVGRKLAILPEEEVQGLIRGYWDVAKGLIQSENDAVARAGRQLTDAVAALERSQIKIAEYRLANRGLASQAVATAALRQFSLVAGCAYLGKATLAATGQTAPHHRRFRTDLCFFANDLLSEVFGLERVIAEGEGILANLDENLLLDPGVATDRVASLL
ncbi:acyl-CoA dehydrogenase family protein [Ruegeria sp.]|uniref:acyl-CoA dehydrogenase family protein n=1 Tax=Ruegeria sp. TaxID=1879320 RepID=UPI003C7C4D06